LEMDGCPKLGEFFRSWLTSKGLPQEFLNRYPMAAPQNSNP
jgi:hypothetical protein